MKKEQWSLRPYKAGDEDNIRSLFELVFGKETRAEHWQWQFKGNRVDLMAISVAESHTGELVGQCALRPVRMKVGEKNCLAAQSLDAMVHPTYRRQGLFTELATYSYELAANRGIALVYGFPNQNSHHVLANKLKRVDLWDTPPMFVKLLNIGRVLNKRIGNGLLRSVARPVGVVGISLFDLFNKGSSLPTDCRLRRVTHFDERINSFWDNVSDSHNILVVRDSHYLNWRFVENPAQNYVLFIVERDSDIVGYAVLKCEERFGLKIGYIVDILTISDQLDVSGGLISAALTHFQEQQVDIVGCLMFDHVPQAQSLRKWGFVKVPPKFFPQELHLSVRNLSSEYSDHYITDPKNWFITLGDHDVI